MILFQQVESNLVLTHTIPHIFQETQSVVCYLLDESAEQGGRRHPLDRIPNTTSPYPLCFAWLISGLSNWTGMTTCFSHFYGLEHLKNKKVGQNILVHLCLKYQQCSSHLPNSPLFSRGYTTPLQFPPVFNEDSFNVWSTCLYLWEAKIRNMCHMPSWLVLRTKLRTLCCAC